jgi:hypothetical protein
MVDIPMVSIAIASASVVAGVIYYAFQIRHQEKMRHLDLFMHLYSTWGSRDFLDAHRRFMTIKVKDYESFVKEHGPVTDTTELYTDIDQVGWFFNLMGFLVKENIVNIKQVEELLGYWVLKNWETIKPLLYEWRTQYNIPESYKWFEYLYDEMRKREQAGVKNG